MAFEAPTSKHQAPEKLQALNIYAATKALGLMFEVWSFSGAWMLSLVLPPRLANRLKVLPANCRHLARGGCTKRTFGVWVSSPAWETGQGFFAAPATLPTAAS